MRFYRINSKINGWGSVNLRRVIAVDFDEESGEIVFDGNLRIKVINRIISLFVRIS